MFQNSQLPPGMNRRNPGTKKIALETPVRTLPLFATYSETFPSGNGYIGSIHVKVAQNSQNIKNIKMYKHITYLTRI